jgi:RNA polymerase primary sigma factor
MRQFKKTERFTPRTTKAEDVYLAEVDRNKMISVEEEVELAKRSAEGDIEARNKLVSANLRFVLTVAKMYSRDPTTYSDLVAAGNLGLIEAANKFDHTRGFKFISYAVWHIRKEMIEHLNVNSKVVRIPGNKTAFLRLVRNTAIEIEMVEGRTATPTEILDLINEGDIGKNYGSKSMTTGQLERLIIADIRPSSFDAPLSSEEGSGSLYDITPSEDSQRFGDLEDIEYLLSEFMRELNPMEKFIVEMKHGINDPISQIKDFGEIGKILSVSSETVRSKYNKALRKMKIKAKRSKILMDNIS